MPVGPVAISILASGERIETGVNWQADMARTCRKLVESAKTGKVRGSRNREQSRTASIATTSADALEAWYIEKGGFLRSGFGRDQNSRGGFAQNPVPWLHGL